MLLLAACAAQEPFKIGVIAAQTGAGDFFGQQELRGLELAREDINTHGGIQGRQVEFVIEDSATTGPGAVTAMQKLINVDGLKFIIGDSWASSTVPIVPIANNASVILISPIAGLDSLSADDFFFRTMAGTSDMMKAIGAYACAHNLKRVAAIRSETPFGIEHVQSFKTALAKCGGELVREEKVELSDRDFHTALLHVKESHPDAVFDLVASGATIGLLMKQALEVGIADVPYFSSFGAEASDLLTQYGRESEGIVYPYPYDSSASGSVEEFRIKYKQKYGDVSDNTAANAYDALMLLAKAINNAGEETTAVKYALLDVQNYSGASGTVSFNQNGDVKKKIILKHVHNNSFVKME